MDEGALVWIAVGSIATTVIVLINLYLIFIKPRFEKPKFTVKFKMDEPFCRKTISDKFDKFVNINQDADIVGTNWFRVKIKNLGKSEAHRCIGKLVEIWNDDEDKAVDQFDPTQLLWVSTSWKEVPFRDISLNRQEYEYLDVVAAQQGDENLYICGDQFPWARYGQRGIRNRLKPGSYILHITAYGDNVDPETKYLSVIWGGQHFKDISVEIHNTFDRAKNWLHGKQND